jgi:hypothetical protein
MMSHEQVIYSSIATVLHELNIQSTTLIAQECVNLIDSLIKTMTFDIDDVTACKS